MYVPSATGSQSGVVIMHPAANCTTFNSDDSTCTVAAVKKAVTLFTNDYAPTKTGGGASGTWGISITGNAAYADSAGTCTSLSTNAGSATKAIYFSGGKPAKCNDALAHSLLFRSIGTSSQNHAEALKSEFDTNKGSIPRNSLLSYYSSSYGNGSLYQGYYLANYDSNPYGGFYVCHYNTPYYVGIQNGTFTQFQLWKSGDAVTGAVWNDYAECREANNNEPGRVLIENGDDTLSISTERLQQFAGICSDTWGFSQGETDKAKTHIAVAGRVLAYPYQDRNNYKPGDAVCAAPEGTVDIMTEEEIMKYPHRIIGTVSCVPTYETWGGGNDRDPVQVNGRIWIKVK